jgi:hypothetical protein
MEGAVDSGGQVREQHSEGACPGMWTVELVESADSVHLRPCTKETQRRNHRQCSLTSDWCHSVGLVRPRSR